MKKTTFFALATAVIATLTFSTHSYAKTPGEKLDNTIDKINDSYHDAKDNVKDKYKNTKDKAKEKYNDTKEKIKDGYNDGLDKIKIK